MSIARHESGPILSLAVEHGDTVYLAGIVPKDLKKDIKGQTQEVLAEIDRLLGKCGTSKSKLLKATIWVTDIQPRADERSLDGVDRPEEPAGARLRRGQARRSGVPGRNHGGCRERLEVGLTDQSPG